MTQLMAGKKGLIMGVANSNSIAWGIAQALHAHGAELAFTYQGDVLKKRVDPLAESVGSTHVLPCDVGEDDQIAHVFDTLGKAWGSLDFVVHAIAFADRDALRGEYIATTRQQFLQALDISCYSFTAVCAHASKYMNEGGSLITLSYYGAEKVLPNYNVMGIAKAALEASVRYIAADLGPKGIRVNAISAGPVRTLAASGIGDLVTMLNRNKQVAPLRRNVSLSDLGGTGVYFLSDLSHGVTGEIHYVDAGYNIMGMSAGDS